MEGTDFLQLAIRLSAGVTEAEWRSAVSRAYYGAFHVARQFVESCGVTLPRSTIPPLTRGTSTAPCSRLCRVCSNRLRT